MKVKLLYLPRYDMDYNTGDLLPYSSYAFIPPVGMPILTSYLRAHGMEVEQDDLLIKVYREGVDKILLFTDKEKVEKFMRDGQEASLEEAGRKILDMADVDGYDVIGFSLFEPDNPTTGIIALVLAKLLKKRAKPKIVIGGRVWGNVRESLIKNEFIDYGILHSPFSAPAEINLAKFCEELKKGKFERGKVPGLEYHERNEVIINPTHYNDSEIEQFVRPNFDGLPLPLYRYGVSCRMNGETRTGEVENLPYLFVKGCPFRCAFCCNSTLPPWIGKPPNEVAKDLKYLVERYGVKFFFFLNTTINPKYRYAEEVADAIIREKLDIKWSDSANFKPLDKHLLRKLKDAGAVRLMFGLESSSQRVLDYLGKNFKVESAEQILRESWEIGIWTELSLICGFPHERMSDVEMTIEFLKRNSKYIRSAYINKFFLDGNIRKYPDKYRIRIREEAFEPTQVMKEEWRGGFDEIDGLSWEERAKLTDESFDRILEAMNEVGINRGSELQQVFFLSSLPEWEDIARGKCHVHVDRMFTDYES